MVNLEINGLLVQNAKEDFVFERIRGIIIDMTAAVNGYAMCAGLSYRPDV